MGLKLTLTYFTAHTPFTNVCKDICKLFLSWLTESELSLTYQHYEHSPYIGIGHRCAGSEVLQAKPARVALVSDLCLLGQQLVQSLGVL